MSFVKASRSLIYIPKKRGGREEIEKNISRKKWLKFSRFDFKKHKPADQRKAVKLKHMKQEFIYTKAHNNQIAFCFFTFYLFF